MGKYPIKEVMMDVYLNSLSLLAFFNFNGNFNYAIWAYLGMGEEHSSSAIMI